MAPRRVGRRQRGDVGIARSVPRGVVVVQQGWSSRQDRGDGA
ncbi:MAG: hypothetical protein V9E94_00025 [Microthrixaceae bacterium]